MADEIRDGIPQLARAKLNVGQAAGVVQNRWREKLRPNLKKAEGGDAAGRNFARCLVFGSISVDLKAQVQGRAWPQADTAEVGTFVSAPGGKAAYADAQRSNPGPAD